MSDVPIADHALISDCHSAALVTTRGSIDWLCFPRFDSPAIFARLLDQDAGHWSIHPAGEFQATRSYLDRTMVLETRFETSTGEVTLTDALAVGRNERGHELGDASPHVVLRRLECSRGSVQMEMTLAARPEYGLVHPIVRPMDGGIEVSGGADFLALSAPGAVEIDEGDAALAVEMSDGDALAFALHHSPSWMGVPATWSQEEIAVRLDDTVQAWRTWSEMHQAYEGPARDLVHHSGRVLQALTFQPTGAIVAAPTTSLPEAIGGARNWDYRYAWVRDASLTLSALWVAACPDEAHHYFEWMTGAAASELHRGSHLQIMFGVGGEHDLSERELPHLSGWRDSRPVRVGNGAWDQRQLDVYGELLDAAFLLADYVRKTSPATARFLVAAADAALTRWTDPDQGIWEMRGPPQHFLYSKLMCWVALDRALKLADQIGAGERVEDWKAGCGAISNEILERGWSDKARAFAQAFDSDELDASALMIPIAGFLPGDDERVVATIRAVNERLTDERGLVYRYRANDGLAGAEGSFLLCTFWLAHAQALSGDVAGATETFERAASYRNDVDLLAEQVDPTTGELLGNFPQAFSHIGLVNAAWAISQADGISG